MRHALPWILLLAACGSSAKTPTPSSADIAADTPGADTASPTVPTLTAIDSTPNFATAASGWLRGDLHFHTNYSEDAKKQGGDDLKAALQIADAWRDPVYLAARPQDAGNGLDFVAVTDHRTDAALHDPDFKHDHLIVLPGEEFGGTSHAGIWGLKKHITADPTHGEAANQRIQDAIAEAHADGALFSINHPTQTNPWVWDVQHMDGIEVWNGPWSAFYGPTTEAEVAARATDIGVEGPFIRQAAVQGAGGGSNAAAMLFWQLHLSGGQHLAPVGGGDRHMLLPAGLPTTYVHQSRAKEFAAKTGKEVGVDGVLGGIAARETFVSRSPFGAQVDLSAEATDGTDHPMGSALVAGATYQIHVEVSRAQDGRLLLYSGSLGKTADGAWPKPQVVWDAKIPSAHAQGTWTWKVPPTGAWLHAVVLEPLLVESIPATMDKVVAILAKLPEGKALSAMIQVFSQMVDTGTIVDPASCDPKAWQEWQGQCMPADKDTWSTYYIPDGLVRLMSAWFEDGKATPYCCGAVSSAFLAQP